MTRPDAGRSSAWSRDPALTDALARAAPPGLLIDHRIILPGDEDALLDEERRSIRSHVVERRRASGAARIVARHLLVRAGRDAGALPTGEAGGPIWPPGITGSLAHDERIAVAAIGPTRDFAAIGIDVEPADALPEEMLATVATPTERRHASRDGFGGRLLFAAKEATYKAVQPLDGVFLEFEHIEVDPSFTLARTATGHAVTLRASRSTHLVVVAWLPA